MPNHCENNLTITGDQKVIDAWLRSNTSPARYRSEEGEGSLELLSFDCAVPMPSELKHTRVPAHEDGEREYQQRLTEKHGHGNWYEWSIANWGTKWDAYDYREVWHGHTELLAEFSTAWTPPLEWFHSMVVHWPKLQFRLTFEEAGCDINGSITIPAKEVSSE